ncbi:MAG: hypothetical protein IKF00_09025, partial [Solobacterium sp.]|nr:hypothetical protein [Solobacterium sp.]
LHDGNTSLDIIIISRLAASFNSSKKTHLLYSMSLLTNDNPEVFQQPQQNGFFSGDGAVQ